MKETCSRGFTLLEIIAVVAIIGILSAAAMVGTTWTAHARRTSLSSTIPHMPGWARRWRKAASAAASNLPLRLAVRRYGVPKLDCPSGW